MCYFSITSINHARYKMPNIFVYDKNSSYVKKKITTLTTFLA